ncbi:MAG: CBS domain-containing protein [Phycisphaerae bacterium]|jgi:CBS domain-containing protein|nr:CBS domain-containing protein [Phycisphaerae bacterium]
MPTVEDILMAKGPDVVVAGVDNTVEEAAKMMCKANVGSVIVKDDDTIAGIFTERDMLARVVAEGLDSKDVKLVDVMSSPVKTCTLDDSVESCADIFKHAHVRHLAVVDDDVLIGVIGMRDVMYEQLTANAKRIEELEKLLD